MFGESCVKNIKFSVYRWGETEREELAVLLEVDEAGRVAWFHIEGKKYLIKNVLKRKGHDVNGKIIEDLRFLCGDFGEENLNSRMIIEVNCGLIEPEFKYTITTDYFGELKKCVYKITHEEQDRLDELIDSLNLCEEQVTA